MDSFAAAATCSAPGELLFKEYGIDAEHVAAAAKESIEAARS